MIPMLPMFRSLRLLCGVVGISATACSFPAPKDLPDDSGDEPPDALPVDAPSIDADDIDAPGADAANIDAPSIDASSIDVPPRERYLEPRNLPDICDDVATMPDFTVSNSANFDTNLTAACTGGVINQAGGDPICVVRYGSIRIASGATLTVTGNRPLALVADSTVNIEGTLDISASGTTNGPGGGRISGAKAETTTAGGGAGFKTAGGNGGSATTDGGGGAGGSEGTDPSLLTALVGGTRPMNFVVSNDGTAVSGGAGGAATLIACRGQVTVTGTIDAGGGGGRGGRDIVFGQMLSFVAGAGGGAGGNVVIQGLTIVVTGGVFANGGGGGAGGATNDQSSEAGQDGTRSATVAAAGGGALGSSAGAGGRGGRQGAAPGQGLHPTGTITTAGGGGGSIGFFQAYTPMDSPPILAPSAASPVFSSNKVINTR